MRNFMFLLVLIFLLQSSLVAQNLKVSYEVVIKIPNNIIKEEMVLLINNKNSVYTSPIKIVADSLRQRYLKNNDLLAYQAEIYNLEKYRLKYSIFKKSLDYMYQIHAAFNEITYKENLPKLNWKIESESKTIAGMKSQKATTTYNNQIITAWFTNEVPVNNGPYTFQGLPGLILMINNQDNSYAINFKGIQKKAVKLPLPIEGAKVVTTKKVDFYKAYLGSTREMTRLMADSQDRKNTENKVIRILQAKFLYEFL